MTSVVVNQLPICRILSRRRFSLAALLVLFTASVIAIACARWRREQTIAEYARLHADGVGLIMLLIGPDWLENSAEAEFWCRKPGRAEIYMTELEGRRYRLGRRTYDWPSAQERLLALQRRLRAVGVEDIQILCPSAIAPPHNEQDQIAIFAAAHQMTAIPCPDGFEEKWDALAP